MLGISDKNMPKISYSIWNHLIFGCLKLQYTNNNYENFQLIELEKNAQKHEEFVIPAHTQKKLTVYYCTCVSIQTTK